MNNPITTNSMSAFSQFFEISNSPFSIIFLSIFGVLCLVLFLAIFSKRITKILRRYHILEESETPKNFLIWILSIIIIIRTVQVFMIQPFLVDGASMYPTFQDNNLLIVDKTYKYREISRDDVVVFKFLKQDSQYSGRYFIKRIIGLPGETVIINGTTTTIISKDGEQTKLTEDFVKNPKLTQYGETKLKDDEYFVMGDNRDGSYDSRAWGPIHKSQLAGEPIVQLFPVVRLYPGGVK